MNWKKMTAFFISAVLTFSSAGVYEVKAAEEISVQYSAAEDEDSGISNGEEKIIESETGDESDSSEGFLQEEDQTEELTSDDELENDSFEENTGNDSFSDGEDSTEEIFSDDTDVEENEFNDGKDSGIQSEITGAVDTSDAIIYALDYNKKDGLPKMESGIPGSYQIPVEKDSGKVSYEVISGYTVMVDENGLVTPDGIDVYNPETEIWDKEYWFGDSVIEVTVGNKKYKIKVTVVNYADYYAEKRMNIFLDNNITENMSQYDKVKKICEWLSNNFDYSVKYYTYTDLMIYGEGDCWANGYAADYMFKQIGLTSYMRWGANDPGAIGISHKGNVVIIDGEKYRVECGYIGKAPRYYSIKKMLDDYTYEVQADGTVRIIQYDGMDSEVRVPDSIDGHKVTVIGKEAFWHSMVPITSVILPDTITTIEDSVFWDCTELESVTIPRSVVSIGKDVFGKTSGKDSKLSQIFVDPENKSYSSKNGMLLDKTGKRLVACPPAVKGICTIPDGITKIDDRVFYNNDKITEVRLPSSIEEIGSETFAQCSVLKKITLPYGLKKIGEKAFYYDTEIESMDIPASVEEIDNEALYNIWRVVIRGTGTKLGENVVHEMGTALIIAPKGSVAEKYAKETGCTFTEMENGDLPSLKEEWFEFDLYNYGYTGEEVEPDVYITESGGFLRLNKDFTVEYHNNINAGQGTVTVKGQGIFRGELTKKFNIQPASLELDFYPEYITFRESGKSSLTVEESGKPLKPAIQVKGYKENQDYTVSYMDNIKPGYATVIIRGTGNYTGTYYTYFYIEKKAMQVKINSKKIVYNGREQKPSVTVTVHGRKLKTSEYNVRYKNNKNIGYASLTVTGKGKYAKYSAAASFRIEPRQTRLTTVKSTGKGKGTVYWERKKEVSGYQIAFSTNSRFSGAKYRSTGNKTSKFVVDRLKSGKIYYFRIRTYKKIGNKNWYSSWSNVKKIKIK